MAVRLRALRGAAMRLIGPGLVLATLLVYFPVASFDYVSFDDPEYVTGNRFVQAGLTEAGVAWAFTTTWSSYWHPLTWLSHMLDAELFGAGPAGPHLVNLALHVLNTVLVFAVLRRATGAPWRSGLVAALFALHPLHVESVAWIAERKDVLSACCFLLSLGAYTRYATAFSNRFAWYIVALVGFGAALMSKPMTVTLPCVLLLWDVWPLGRRFGHWAEKVPFFVLSGGASVLAIVAQRQNGVLHELSRFSIGERVENAITAYAAYLGRTFWPRDLAFFYPHPGTRSALTVGIAATVLVAVAVGIATAVRRARRSAASDRATAAGALTVGWLWFLGMLVPVIGLVQVGDQAMADRYTYLPLLGVFIAVVWLAADLAERRRGVALVAAIAIVAVVACGALARRQLATWRDSEALFRRALAVTENNFVAHNNLGGLLAARGDWDEAARQFERAIALRPEYAPPYNNLATLWLRAGRTDEAVALLQRAVAAQPDFAEVRVTLGDARRAQGQLAAAAGEYREALRLRPDLAIAALELGRVLAAQQRAPEAVTAFERAVALEPTDAVAHAELGIAYLGLQRPVEATGQLEKALELQPDLTFAAEHLAITLLQAGEASRAARWFRQVAAGMPRDAHARNNFGWALLQAGDASAAVQQFEAALQLDPSFKLARSNLSLARARLAPVAAPSPSSAL